MCNPIYVFIVMALTIEYFSISGIQYWCTHYLENHLGASKSDILFYFMATLITAPVLGAMFSGYICSKVGGYESITVLYLCVIACIISIISGLPVPFIDDYRSAIGSFWFVLFSGIFIIPILNGVMLNNVDPLLKEHANSIANLSFNLMGYLPAPTIYGFVNTYDVGNEITSNYGMILLT
jgi:sugar phosphate permease